ncbi:MAG: transposase [Actinobacteria bacterium]|nr:transposase [Actinomycetota bacterium]
MKHFDSSTKKELTTHYFSHPHCPKENAFVERKIQNDKYELWAFEEGYAVGELNLFLKEWSCAYNYLMPH